MKDYLYQFYKLESVIDLKNSKENYSNFYNVLKSKECYHSAFRLVYTSKGEKIDWTVFYFYTDGYVNIYQNSIQYIIHIEDTLTGFKVRTNKLELTFERVNGHPLYESKK